MRTPCFHGCWGQNTLPAWCGPIFQPGVCVFKACRQTLLQLQEAASKATDHLYRRHKQILWQNHHDLGSLQMVVSSQSAQTAWQRPFPNSPAFTPGGPCMGDRLSVVDSIDYDHDAE